MVANTAQIDLAGERVGAIYGTAFFAAAESSGTTAEAIEQLESLVTDVLSPHPELEQLLANPMIAAKDKLETIDRIFGSVATPMVLDFLRVLARKERLGYLRPILEQVQLLENQRENRRRVEVTTATPLNEQMREQLFKQVHDLLSLEPELVAHVDPEILGGIVLKIGDTVYDGSIVAELERLRTQMMTRGTENIETHHRDASPSR
ncbi:MAG: ATP synthase F1 subunit delta [Pirellulales bacterium]|jgi:F-type H+-transporting ATPase subunit delta|nr:ATP synthase F1 subunit delta [Pirellulales bacterium]